MGKYDAVIENLKPAPIVDPDDLKYQEKVNAAKLELTVDAETGEIFKLTPDQLAAAYATLRAKKAEISTLLYPLQVKIVALEQMLVASWDDDEDGWGTYGAGPNTVKLRDGTAVDVDAQPEGKVEDKEKFRLWCLANGLEHKLQLWPSTMNAIAKERCLAGAAPPDGVVMSRRVTVKLRTA